MCVYIYIHTYIYIYIRIHIHVYIYIYITCVYIYIYIYIHTYIHIYIYIYIHMYTDRERERALMPAFFLAKLAQIQPAGRWTARLKVSAQRRKFSSDSSKEENSYSIYSTASSVLTMVKKTKVLACQRELVITTIVQ